MLLATRLKAAASKSFFYGAGSILGKLVGLIMLPIYTQFLSPSEYGIASLLVFYVSLVQLLLGAQLEQGITYFAHNTDHTLTELWKNSVVISLAATSIPTLLSVLYSSQISNLLLKTPEYAIAVSIISFTILIQMVETYSMQYLRIADFYKTYFSMTLLKLLTQLSSNIVLVVFMDMGINGVAISSVLGTLVIAIGASLHPVIMAFKETLSKDLVLDLIKYCYPLWLTGFVGLYVSAIPQFGLSHLASLNDLGLFNLAGNFGTLIAVFFWTPFFSYWQVERFKIYKEKEATAVYGQLYELALLVSLLLTVGISILSKPVITIMASPDYLSSYKAVLPLCLMTLFRYLTWYFAFSFLVTKNTQENFKNNVFNAVATTISAFIAIPIYGFAGAAWALAISGFCTLIYCFSRSKRFYDMKINLTKTVAYLAGAFGLIITADYAANLSHSFITELSIRIGFCLLTLAAAITTMLRLYKSTIIKNKGTTAS